ncbi:general odorant-binding protein 19d-like [Phymastichus coffea]|uniref:general odorant-binding protein 19d-like n=1 Tax=Phymastichus coffea TaxID=108790 RepID=UPI00273CD9AA|nr:general odorant-binding protein 19d-like [Phymastichus coffea]
MQSFMRIFFVLIIAVCIYGDSSEEKRETQRQISEKCKKEVGITEDRPHGPPNLDDPKEKCLHACFMKESGILVDGKVAVENVTNFHKKHWPNFNDETEKKITSCVETANEKSDECDIAAAMMKCIHEKLGPPPPFPRHKE